MASRLLNSFNRLRFYKTLLKVVCKNPSVKCGYCMYLVPTYHKEFKEYAINVSRTSNKGWEADLYTCLDYLPELMYYRPKGKSNCEHWFPKTPKGWEKRIGILEKIISNMEKDLNYYTTIKK